MKSRLSRTVRGLALGAALATAACHHQKAGPMPGASAPRAAIEQFLGAVRAQDLQALSTVWGTTRGAARDQMPRAELEKRELIMMCYLSHDRFDVQGEEPVSGSGARVFHVQITRGELSKVTNFTTVQGASGRWFVMDVDLMQMQDFCNKR